MYTESDIPWLIVPDRVVGPLHTSLPYGADHLAALHCGLRNVPDIFYGCWTHGWVSPYMAVDPRVVMGDIGLNQGNVPYRVARVDQAKYLQQQGYISRAIGMPIAYTKKPQVKRRPGSMLVMPAHSLEYTTHQWRFREFAEDIARIRSGFSEVVVCCHPACVLKEYWINDFKQLGFPIIIGANPCDYNALDRVRHIMEQFEYVTTNTYSSCIAYAAAFGAKVSIFGTYAEAKADDFKDDPMCRINPGFAELSAHLYSESMTRQHLGEFFTHPASAMERTDWGLKQIGYDQVISGREMRREFRWQATNLAPRVAIRAFWNMEMKFANLLPRSVKKSMRLMIRRAQMDNSGRIK